MSNRVSGVVLRLLGLKMLLSCRKSPVRMTWMPPKGLLFLRRVCKMVLIFSNSSADIILISSMTMIWECRRRSRMGFLTRIFLSNMSTGASPVPMLRNELMVMPLIL